MNVYRLELGKLSDDDLRNAAAQIPNKSIILFDDVDTVPYTNKRTEKRGKEKAETTVIISTGNDQNNNRVQSNQKNDLAVLLNILDGAENLSECIIIMTTNHPEKLDSALIRAGRVDLKLEFEPCNMQQLTDIIKFVYHVEDEAEIKKLLEGIDEEKFVSKKFKVAEVINSWILPNYLDWNQAKQDIIFSMNKTSDDF